MTSLVFTRHCGYPSKNINPLLELGQRRLAQLAPPVVRQLLKVCTLIRCWRPGGQFAAQASCSPDQMRELRYETLNDDRSVTSLAVLPLLLLDQNMPRRIESRNGSPKEACDILLGIVVRPGLSVAKISAGMVGRSLRCWPMAWSPGDVLSGHVVFFGLKITVKPPDADHSYGHAKLNRLQRCAWATR
jgi:hypothetical protein